MSSEYSSELLREFNKHLAGKCDGLPWCQFCLGEEGKEQPKPTEEVGG